MENLLTEFFFLFQRINWLAILDILLVTMVFYAILMTLRDSQAMVLLRGVLFLIIIFGLLTTIFTLPAFSWLLRTSLPELLFAIPVIFAPEIRLGLEHLGQARIVSVFLFRSPIPNEAIEEMINAIVSMPAYDYQLIITGLYLSFSDRITCATLSTAA